LSTCETDLAAALRAGCLIAALGLWASPVRAQASPPPLYLRADLLVASKYVWRGITRSQFPTLQGHGVVAIQRGAMRLAIGAFASHEPFRPDAGEHTLIGIGARGLGEADYWAEASAALGELELAGGLVRYTFHGDAARGGRSSAANTSELFLRFDARGISFSPSVTAWVDVGNVRGTYLELRAAAPLLGWPYQPPAFVTLDAELGLSLGQDTGSARRANFAGDGPTHLQLGLSGLQGLAPWVDLSVGLRGQLGFDDSVKLGADGDRRRLKGWITVGAVVRPVRQGGR
jgi:hypothetical protein